MKRYLITLSLFFVVLCCNKQSPVLYQSEQFTVYADKVIQGKNVATIESSTKIVSNYRSLASENYSRLITFKLSINEKDNEAPSGVDHRLIIGQEHESPIIKFGQKDSIVPVDPGTKLPVNYEYIFRVDMTAVLNQFREKGYFETYDGNYISKDDFKAVYLAGGSEPLTWDFDNLAENKLEMTDPDGDGIYELRILLNQDNTSQIKTNEWILCGDILSKPAYHSEQKIVDALFNMSLEEGILNIEPDSTLRTGVEWPGVWTRDVSYSTILAFAFHEPESAKKSLMRKIKRDRIIQDTGSGGAWPVSSDRVVWAIAAWEIYKITGDNEWLKTAYKVVRNTLEDDYKTLKSDLTGLYKGESSFLDWRQQTYPTWMSNTDIAASENLGTNALHYKAHIVLAEMAKLLGEPYELYQQRAMSIKEGMNMFLWMNDKGYYGQYLYGRTSRMLSPRFEALGEALAVLFDIADEKQAKRIIENSPITPFGVTCIYPQTPGIPPYHNNGIWPFVQSYWNLAAAKTGNEKVLNQGLAAIYRAGALFLTNYENFVAETGDYIGTEINSKRMLWSIAGNLAMVHRVFMGMSFEVDGIRFQPVIPSAYSGTKILTNFKYRRTILDITVEGHGNEISSITLDGTPLKDAFFPASVSGNHKIVIKMANNRIKDANINLVKNKFTLSCPNVEQVGHELKWENVKGAELYKIYKNGSLLSTTKSTAFPIEQNIFGEYSITAVENDGTESFGSQPISIYEKSKSIILEAEKYVKKVSLPYTNFSGEGFVKISPANNNEITITVNAPEEGIYILSCRYSNGTGPWNTDNNCAVRSLYVNNNYKGVLVFPQRGTDEWSDWDFSNSIEIRLNYGTNKICLVYENWNINMDGDINEAMLDYFRLIKKN